MQPTLRFLIIDGYPKPSRDQFDMVGMKYASRLYVEMLKKHLPEAKHNIWLASDDPAPLKDSDRSITPAYSGPAATSRSITTTINA